MSLNNDNYLRITEQEKKLGDRWRKLNENLIKKYFSYISSCKDLDSVSRQLHSMVPIRDRVAKQLSGEDLAQIQLFVNDLKILLKKSGHVEDDVSNILLDVYDKKKLEEALVKTASEFISNNKKFRKDVNIGIGKNILCYLLCFPFVFPGLLLKRFFIKKEIKNFVKTNFVNAFVLLFSGNIVSPLRKRILNVNIASLVNINFVKADILRTNELNELEMLKLKKINNCSESLADLSDKYKSEIENTGIEIQQHF